MAWNGALAVRGVTASPSLAHGQTVDVPGKPTALWTPGHTRGHCGLAFDDLDVLMTGDALVTLDPYTGQTGPRIVAGAATADSEQALASLEEFRASGASTLLPGHGEPWRHGVLTALAEARKAGPS
jgi:glyoxylase-like metal-dependent hydrolase (beta-lactamase superfamily II)